VEHKVTFKRKGFWEGGVKNLKGGELEAWGTENLRTHEGNVIKTDWLWNRRAALYLEKGHNIRKTPSLTREKG